MADGDVAGSELQERRVELRGPPRYRRNPETLRFMDHRIRHALTMGSINKLAGQIEADETFIGGKARNMHKAKRAEKITGTGGKDKTAVMGILERGGKVITKVVPNTKKKALQSEIRDHVLAGSALFTDALKSYEGFTEFQHEVVDHAVEYVRGEAHTNGMENFWSLLKRGLHGTYISVEPFHLFRYLDEQAFRYNHREGFNDGQRFDLAVRKIVGKRVDVGPADGQNGSSSMIGKTTSTIAWQKTVTLTAR